MRDLPTTTAADLALYAYRTNADQSELAWSQWLESTLNSQGWNDVQTFHFDDHEVFLASKDAQTVVVFRGSDRLPDWINNTCPRRIKWDNGAQVHFGYSLALAGFENILLPKIAAAYAHNDIHFVGHSKGGALACLTALRCTDVGACKPASVTTFGAPRCLDHLGARMLETMTLGTVRRFVNTFDPVPQAWWSTGFKHAGTELYFDRERMLRSNPGWWWKMWDRWQAWYASSDTSQVHSMATYRRLVHGAAQR